MALHNYIYIKHEDPIKGRIARPGDPRPKPINPAEKSGKSRDTGDSGKKYRISVNMVDGVGSAYDIEKQWSGMSDKVSSESETASESSSSRGQVVSKEKWVIIDGKRRKLRSRFSEKVFERRKSETNLP